MLASIPHALQRLHLKLVSPTLAWLRSTFAGTGDESLNQQLFSPHGAQLPIRLVALSLLVVTVLFASASVTSAGLGYLVYLAPVYAACLVITACIAIWIRATLDSFASASGHFIDLPAGDIAYWWRVHLRKLYSRRRWWLSVLTLGPVGLAALAYQTQWWTWPAVWFGSTLTDSIAFLAIALFVICGNESVTVILGLPELIYDLSKLPFRRPLYLDSELGLPAIGSLVFRTALVSTLDYSLFLGAVLLFSPLNRAFEGALAGIFAIFGIIILVFFFGSQYGLHRGMVVARNKQIRELDPQLWRAWQAMSRDPKDDNIDVVLRLEQVHSALNAAPGWPFVPQQVVAVMGAVVMPVIAAYIQHLLFP